jgi:CMP-N-acetylneuraminic acid synthetase
LEAAHCLYAGRMDLIERGIWMGKFTSSNDPVLYRMKEEECFDIDYAWQFELAEALYRVRYG